MFSHAVAGLSLGACFIRSDTPWGVLALGAACAVVPDLDVTGLTVGIGLDHPFGHRGFSHSLVFAALVATALASALRRRCGSIGTGALWAYFFLAMASHGVLDAFTNGGRGVAFLAPFSAERYHFPARPIEVSPIGIAEFFTERGVTIMANELVWIWLPAFVLAAAVLWRRRRRTERGLPLPARQSSESFPS